MATLQFISPPPALDDALLSFPKPAIALITLNRPRALNSLRQSSHEELHQLWEWYDGEPSLRVAVITGAGRAFSAGADLKEWAQITGGNKNEYGPRAATARPTPSSAFAGLSRRTGRKPVIAAVNGLAYGGGCEAVINCDLVFASARHASFGFPEVKRGVFASAGALPRIVRTVGKQRAMDMVLTGRVISAQEAKDWGFVNDIVEGDTSKVVGKALEVANTIAANSPDAVIVSRQGVMMGWEGVGAEEGARLFAETFGPQLAASENIREGLKAFVEKREPNWVPSKL
ncbi:uncharacterized protein Z520_03947 [Fonsecaea multimorphosa CBS 102226]|uniref:Enoyl-CoA hydratase n=1 Tax=Fonsecaea multimorphosa CBS 102226 TaxID=1442371 RepID=A0A0D2ITG4_9EURO|nr:uncharacterized protein Z520_03947 [Fonsecaea multimorphosa CBS 102226]KIY00262.1 hypothetical protein Z520_03947 [Fonsecaea multimorphosa CBS 102226]OAL27097.1 hypothetical protein AYO22_03728 [Fonsecaea multimorphosa]